MTSITFSQPFQTFGLYLSLLALSFPSFTYANNDSIANGSSLERAGLTNEWFTQIEVGARSKIVNLEINVNEDKTTRYYLVEYGNVVERISQFDLNAFGKEYGIEGAEKYAATRKEIVTAELAAQGRKDISVTIRPISLPKTTIFAATSRGKVTAIDADTGKQRWQTKIGNPKYLTSGVGASKNHVAVVNGSTVYCLTADGGRILWSRDCDQAPSAAPAVGENNIYVPMINGRLEVFPIDQKVLTRSFVSFGPSVAAPLLTDKTVSWATRDGFYAVAPYNAQTIQFRLDSGGRFAAGGIGFDGKIFVPTTSGSVFALDEKNGSILWEYSTGDRITQKPFVKAGEVYLISAENRMFKFDTNTGRPSDDWEKPVEGVAQFVATSRERIYALDFVGQIIAIDPKTGKKVSTVLGSNVSLIVPNTETDRLYVGTESGIIRCLRETSNTYPIFHANDQEGMVDANQTPTMPEETDSDDPIDDPFAAESDPFASDDGESDPFASDDDSDPFSADDASDEDADPFSSGDSDDSDPFGGNSSDDDEDPFGGGDDDDEDPFGG
ncbi:MAG: PQQ-binding-like beta-propeller repeat protein [Planctomycetota bacterium]